MKRVLAILGVSFLLGITSYSDARNAAGSAMRGVVPPTVYIVDPATTKRDSGGVVGLVREVRETTTVYGVGSGILDESIVKSWRSLVTLYDRNGQVLAYGDPSGSGTALDRRCRTYDGYDRLIMEMWCKDGEPAEPIVKYVYENEDLVASIGFDKSPTGTWEERVRYRYRRDSRHRLIERLLLYRDGTIREKRTYDYDSEGREREERQSIFRQSNDEVLMERTVYEYGEDGQVMIADYRRQEDEPYITRRERFDAHGNMIERQWDASSGMEASTERITYEYDAMGNWIVRTTVQTYAKPEDRSADRKEVVRRTLTYYSD